MRTYRYAHSTLKRVPAVHSSDNIRARGSHIVDTNENSSSLAHSASSASTSAGKSRIRVRVMAIALCWWSRIRPAQIQAQVRGWMVRVMAIALYWWCLVSYAVVH